MSEVLVGLSAAWAVLVIVFLVLVILIPVFIYLTQRYLYDIRDEVRQIKDAAIEATGEMRFISRAIEKRLPPVPPT